MQYQFQFSGMDTCAVDGMCATDCRVSINTGELIKRLRRENHSAAANKMALNVAKNFGIVERLVKMALMDVTSCTYYSSGKTCEMAMYDATGKNYQSIFYLLDAVTE